VFLVQWGTIRQSQDEHLTQAYAILSQTESMLPKFLGTLETDVSLHSHEF
jgi:hypothetical protein